MNKFIEQIIHHTYQIESSKLDKLRELILSTNGNIIILGNGGSNAIASHMAEDYTKILKKPTICFSDAARLTCYANDYGYENSFVQYLSEFVEKDGIVILISSSGESKNIVKCVEYCMKENIPFITLTGFKSTNSIRNLQNTTLEFWIDSTNYGVVECIHEIILHSIL